MKIVVKRCPSYDVFIHFNNARPEDSVAKLKDLIEAKIGFPCDQQKLSCNGQALEKGTLSDYNITGNAVVYLEHKIFTNFDITVENLTDKKTMTVNISENDFVEDLKAKIMNSDTSLRNQSLLLSLDGVVIENGHKLFYYDIKEGSLIKLKHERDEEETS